MIAPEILAIFLFCLVGSGWQAYKIGSKKGQAKGIDTTIDHLIETGRLEVAEE